MTESRSELLSLLHSLKLYLNYAAWFVLMFINELLFIYTLPWCEMLPQYNCNCFNLTNPTALFRDHEPFANCKIILYVTPKNNLNLTFCDVHI